MLTTSPQILKKLQSYKDRNFFSYSSDLQTITLNCDLHKSWINDDEFFRNIFFGGPDLNSSIALRLSGSGAAVVDVLLESRSIPNITHYLWSLGYKPSIYTEYNITPKDIGEEFELVRTECNFNEKSDIKMSDLAELDRRIELFAVSIVKEPVNEQCKIPEETPLSTSQPKTTKKRK